MSTDNNTIKDNKTLYYSLVCGLPSLVILGLSTYIYLNRKKIFLYNNSKKNTKESSKCCKCGDDCKCNPCECCKCGDDCKCNPCECCKCRDDCKCNPCKCCKCGDDEDDIKSDVAEGSNSSSCECDEY